MKKYEVSESFILEAHRAACQGWQRKIEKAVPEAFSIIRNVKKFSWYIDAREGCNRWILTGEDGRIETAAGLGSNGEYYPASQDKWNGTGFTNANLKPCDNFHLRIGNTLVADFIEKNLKEDEDLCRTLDTEYVRDKSVVYFDGTDTVWYKSNKTSRQIPLFNRYQGICSVPKRMSKEEALVQFGVYVE